VGANFVSSNSEGDSSNPNNVNNNNMSNSSEILKTRLDLEPTMLVSDALLTAIDQFNRDEF